MEVKINNQKFLLDFDDVMLKTGDEKVRWLRQNISIDDLLDKNRPVESIKPYECSRTVLTPIVGHDNYERMIDYVYGPQGTAAIQPLDGALEGVAELSKVGEVYVVSARKQKYIGNTKVWLQDNGFDPYITPSNIFAEDNEEFAVVNKVAGSKKVGIAKHLGAVMFVDDDERHMPKEPVEGLHCLLFGPLKRRYAPNHIVIAKDWNEVVEYARNIKT